MKEKPIYKLYPIGKNIVCIAAICMIIGHSTRLVNQLLYLARQTRIETEAIEAIVMSVISIIFFFLTIWIINRRKIELYEECFVINQYSFFYEDVSEINIGINYGPNKRTYAYITNKTGDTIPIIIGRIDVVLTPNNKTKDAIEMIKEKCNLT